MALEIVRVAPGSMQAFAREHEREALRAFYEFSVVWHEQQEEFAALDGEQTVGIASIRIAASLAHVERVIVAPSHRRRGIGRALLQEAGDVASYYNCHKMSALVPHQGTAQKFFERCDYHEEAVLPQHTFKLDMAMLRKFLL